MKIKFHKILYVLKDNVNVMPAHFQATIDKGDNTFDDVIADTVDVEEITVYNDDNEVTAIYTGYTKRIAICIYPNDNVSVELENTDITGAINTLTQQMSEVQNTQEQQASAIEELTPYTETKIGYYGETSKTFYGVPDGNVTVFFDNYHGAYTTSRQEDRLYVYFDALEKETNITISIM